MLPYHQNFLSNHPLISSFSEEEFSNLKQSIHLHAMKSGELLFNQGDPADCFYILVSGRLKLFRMSFDGQEKVVDIINPGNAFAEAVMFMHKNAFPVCCEALEVSEVFAINSNKYLMLLEKNISICFKLMADLSMRIHGKLNEIDTLTLQNATYRVIHYLLSNAKTDEGDRMTISLDVSKRLIASHLAIQPETFSRILKKLKQKNILNVTGREIVILDKNALIDFQ